MFLRYAGRFQRQQEGQDGQDDLLPLQADWSFGEGLSAKAVVGESAVLWLVALAPLALLRA